MVHNYLTEKQQVHEMPIITQYDKTKTIELRVVAVPSAVHRRLRMHALGSGKSNSEIVIAILDAKLPQYPAEVASA